MYHSLRDEIQEATSDNIDAMDGDGKSLLHRLAEDKSIQPELAEELLEMIIRKGGNVDVHEEGSPTALVLALRAGAKKLEFANKLLENGADPLLEFERVDKRYEVRDSRRIEGGFTAMHTAVKEGRCALVERMLASVKEQDEFDINEVKSDRGWSLMHDAVNINVEYVEHRKKIKMIRLLLNNDASVNIPAGLSGRTALSDALKSALLADTEETWEVFACLVNHLGPKPMEALSSEVDFCNGRYPKPIWQHLINVVEKYNVSVQEPNMEEAESEESGIKGILRNVMVKILGELKQQDLAVLKRYAAESRNEVALKLLNQSSPNQSAASSSRGSSMHVVLRVQAGPSNLSNLPKAPPPFSVGGLPHTSFPSEASRGQFNPFPARTTLGIYPNRETLRAAFSSSSTAPQGFNSSASSSSPASLLTQSLKQSGIIQPAHPSAPPQPAFGQGQPPSDPSSPSLVSDGRSRQNMQVDDTQSPAAGFSPTSFGK